MKTSWKTVAARIQTRRRQRADQPEQRIVDAQLRTQRELLNSLLSGCDTQILELTKLKVANTQLIEALNEIRDATHRYLFWVPDVNPINFSYPLNVAHDLTRVLSLDTLSQLGGAFMMMVTSRETLIPIFGALLLVIFSISSRKHYHAFLERASSRVGKVTQDEFFLTVRTVFWSILVAMPLPVLWAALGYGLQSARNYPVAEAIGKGVTATLPILWICMICAAFAHPQGLFIVHFRWPAKQVSRAMRYYKMSIWLIVPLIMALITFDSLKEREFANTTGRLCFILLCLALALVTHSLKRAGIPLYLDKTAPATTCSTAPSGAATVGAAAGGVGLDRRLPHHRAGAVGAHGNLGGDLVPAAGCLSHHPPLDADPAAAHRLRSRQTAPCRHHGPARPRRRRNFAHPEQHRRIHRSGRFGIRSGHHQRPVAAAGAFDPDADRTGVGDRAVVGDPLRVRLLENISLWDVTSTVNGVETAHPITLGAVLIAILVLIITMQLVRNLPALLELAVLQHRI